VNSPALTKTRVVLSSLMATATLATAGLATSLALARHTLDEGTAAADTSVTANPEASEHDRTSKSSTTHHSTHTSTGFTPAPPAKTSSGAGHTRTKGS